MARPDGWSWFADDQSTDRQTSGTPHDDAAVRAFARCFSGPDGQRVLATLRALTLERALGPDAGDAALRHLEGQRQLVLTIQALTTRGRNLPA